MNKYFYLFVVVCPILIFGQNNKDLNSSKKDLFNSEEVFFNESLDRVKSGKIEGLDSNLNVINRAAAYFFAEGMLCELSKANAVKGRVFYNYGQPDSATASYITASKYNPIKCPYIDQYYLYNSWSIMYLDMADYQLADSLNRLALKATNNIKNKTYRLNVLTNKALMFSGLGENDSAIAIMKNIHNEALRDTNEYHLWSSLQNLGTFYLRTEQYDSSFYFLSELSNLVTDDTPPRLVMDLYNNIAVIYDRKKDFKQAAKNYYIALELAKKHKELNKQLIYLENYSSASLMLGNYEESRAYLREYVNLKDSLQSAEKIQYIKYLEKEYETGKQREIILLLERADLKKDLIVVSANRFRDVVIAVMIGVLILAIGLYRRMIYIRKSKDIVEREKKRSDELLLNILPAQVAEELKEKGESEARQYNDVSVLFTDFVAFTQFTQKLSAKELVQEIGYCFKSFDDICSRYNIEKIKTIGDAYMAAGGVPATDVKSAENAIRAALDMQEFMKTRYAEKTKNGEHGLRMRSGIHSGPVVAGIVGVKKFQYDIWGDTVNTAARMESSGEAEKVNISITTYNYVKNVNDFNFTSRGKIDVKGKGKIEMFYVSLKSTG